MTEEELHDYTLQYLDKVIGEKGFNASASGEAYGDAFFGRDGAIATIEFLELLTLYPHKFSFLESKKILRECKRTLLTIISSQAKVSNEKTGAQPGKFIHEMREKGYERLVNRKQDPSKPWINPWEVGIDKILRNYDSVDSTPLGLIAMYKYWEFTNDNEFAMAILPSVEEALNWITSYGDIDKDALLEFDFPHTRTSGGLTVQNWMDSRESLTNEKGQLPKYPIATVEVQGFAWLALKLWGDFYKDHNPEYANKLISQAEKMKQVFNEKFIIRDKGLYFAAQALDGDKNQIKTITINPLLLLWASYGRDGKIESIIDDKYIPDLVKRGFMPDMFDKGAGIRTMSTTSPTYNPKENSYHNGPVWTMPNFLTYLGLKKWQYTHEANQLSDAAIKPMLHFGSPIELCISKGGSYFLYKSPSGQQGCKIQTWSIPPYFYWLTSRLDTQEKEEQNRSLPLAA